MSDVIAADQLRLFIERIERLEEEKKGISEDIRDVYAEAKAMGYDTKTMRACVKLRGMEKHVRDEAEMMLDTYKAALGLDYSSTPLGEAAVRRHASRPEVVRADSVEEEVHYQTALGMVVESQKASTSWLQRQLRVGYNSAALLIDRLEREGIVSAPDHVGARKVLVADLVRASSKSILHQVADQVNAGALGTGVTATVN